MATTTDQELEQQLIDSAEESFMRLGIRSVSMDDIARSSGRAKKTIYRFFANKDALVRAVLERHIQRRGEAIQQILSSGENAIDAWRNLYQFNCTMMRAVHPGILFDLAKYHPEQFEQYRQFKLNFVVQMVEHNLRQGCKQGLYRDDLDIPIVARLYCGRLELLHDPDFFPETQFQREEVFKTFMHYHLNAIVTDKGKEYMDQHPIE